MSSYRNYVKRGSEKNLVTDQLPKSHIVKVWSELNWAFFAKWDCN